MSYFLKGDWVGQPWDLFFLHDQNRSWHSCPAQIFSRIMCLHTILKIGVGNPWGWMLTVGLPVKGLGTDTELFHWVGGSQIYNNVMLYHKGSNIFRGILNCHILISHHFLIWLDNRSICVWETPELRQLVHQWHYHNTCHCPTVCSLVVGICILKGEVDQIFKKMQHSASLWQAFAVTFTS